MTFDEFMAEWAGKPADYDGSYGNQCVDLFNFYNRDVVHNPFIGTPSTGGAADLWNDYASVPNYTKIPNSPSAVPPKGAVVVWAANTKATGPAGHVGIASGVGDDSYFISFDQNYPTGSLPHLQRHTYDGVLGWYVPTNNQGTTTMPVLDLARARVIAFAILGRNGEDGMPNALNGDSDADLNANHVGQDPYEQIWAFYNSAEGQTWLRERLPAIYQRAGDLAQQAQAQTATIDGLNKQVQELTTALQAAQDALKQPPAPTPPPGDNGAPATSGEPTGDAGANWLDGLIAWLKSLRK